MKYLPLLLLLVLVACVKEPIGWYPDVGVIEMISDSTTITFNVPDTDTMTPGWNPWGSGQSSKNFNITFKERAKKKVAITYIMWEFFNVNGYEVGSRSEIYVPPLEVKGGEEYVLTPPLAVIVNEDIADELDDADSPENDFDGDGTVKFTVYGYDLDRGEDINCIPSFTPIHVQK